MQRENAYNVAINRSQYTCRYYLLLCYNEALNSLAVRVNSCCLHVVIDVR